MNKEGDDLVVTDSEVYITNQSLNREITNSEKYDETNQVVKDNNYHNYYGSNVLSGPSNPSVGNQVTQHMKTEKEREM